MKCHSGFCSTHSNHKVRGGVGFERKKPRKSSTVNWVQYLLLIKKNETYLLQARVVLDLNCCQEDRSL